MTVCSSAQRKKRKMSSKIRLQRLGDHDEFLNRITKTLYYGKIPLTDRFSLPVSELASEFFSEVKKGYSLDRLYVDDAAEISRNACVSPCSLVLALVYLERLKTCNSEYVERVAPSELFLVSMMVASKFLHDDGEEDEVFNDEWATSAGLELKDMNRLEREFLNAINWEVYVSEQVFWSRLRSMETELALREGKRRGWFSYTELTHLVNATELLSLAHTFITVSAVCLTSYTASVLAMVGSTIVVNQIPSVATNLVSNSLPSTTFVLPSALPLSSPDACLSNETLPGETSRLLEEWNSILDTAEENDTKNHSFSDDDDNFHDLDIFHIKKKNEWSEQKDWLTSITDLAKVATITDFVKVASTPTHPTMIVPVEILTY